MTIDEKTQNSAWDAMKRKITYGLIMYATLTSTVASATSYELRNQGHTKQETIDLWTVFRKDKPIKGPIHYMALPGIHAGNAMYDWTHEPDSLK